ncbi:arylesterase [Pseudofulvimonas gallinarii]|jgi:acyl-CoA thioesterase-1|uniref:Acyl-CoA thioesterase-1 n=1 Tax=Pseudofulvimonas gallinarii TaxID=634155 RepID=A0A4V2UW37_9GAMM|nr:arylesterase [Pseudofulvimonas gallinarii]TCS98207.1 acyl-CoA thioesterase-1 [Pseudofulvimonas gallinarii]THD13816.1 arylesterase [Pseudofulvimonas gallinarii]
MRPIFRVLLCVLLLPSIAWAKGGTIVILGDSLSAAHGMPAESGWVSLLARRLQDQGRDHPVVNASISGETTAGGLARLPGLLATHRPSVLVIELGANDGLRGLAIAQIRDNLAAMIELADSAGARVVLLGIELPVNFGRRYRSGLRSIYSELSQAHGTALVPFLLEGVALEPELVQDDGLHPTAQAQPRLLDTVWPVLSGVLEDRANLP